MWRLVDSKPFCNKNSWQEKFLFYYQADLSISTVIIYKETEIRILPDQAQSSDQKSIGNKNDQRVSPGGQALSWDKPTVLSIHGS